MAKFKNLLLDVIVETENELVIEQFNKSNDYELIEETPADETKKDNKK